MGLAEWPEFRPGELLRTLVAERVDFVMVGGLAAVVHGSAAITRDLDITYAPDQDNLERLGRAMVALDARLRGVAEDVPFVPEGRTLRRTQILTLATPDGSIDLLAQPDGCPPYARLKERAWRAELAGVTVPVASLEDLIAMKKAAGRPKDLVAVEELEAIQRLQREMS